MPFHANASVIARWSALSLAIVVLIGACGGSSVGASAPAPASSSSAAAGSAAADPLATLVAAAKKEGTLTFYVPTQEGQIKPISDGFKAKYGIEVVSVTGNTSTLLTKFQGELKAGVVDADVMSISSGKKTFDGFGAEGIFQDLSGLPAWKEFPTEFKATKFWFTPTLGIYTITYNTDRVKAADAPKAWADLSNSRWAGQVGIYDPHTPVGLGYFVFLLKNLGPDYIAKIGELKPKLYGSSALLAQACAAGEVAICFPGAAATLQGLKDKGAPIAWLSPPPATALAHNLAVTAKAKHPNAALLFANFMMTKEGQGLYNGKNQGGSPLNVPGTIALPSGFQTLDEDPPATEQAKILPLLGLK